MDEREKKNAKDEKNLRNDAFFKITLLQICVCLSLTALLLLCGKFFPKSYKELKTAYNSAMSESIEAFECFGSLKKVRDFVFESGSLKIGRGDVQKGKYIVSFSPYFTTQRGLMPVSGRVSSPYGRRADPFSGEMSIHSGLDLACEEGCPVFASMSGRVNKVGEDSTAGKYISLTHSDNLETFYCHCSEIIAKSGENIRRGERIALVGSTGLSTGPHLHFEVRIGEKKLDPRYLLGEKVNVL